MTPHKFTNIKPILGSELKTVRLGIKKRGSRVGGNEREKVRCGVQGIDEDVLRGGFERGCVVGFTGDLGGGDGGGGGLGGGCAVGRLITMHLIASVVLGDLQSHQNPSSASATTNKPQSRTTQHKNPMKLGGKARAAIIDTTGSFPLPLLAAIIQKRTLRIYEKSGIPIKSEELEATVRDCLECVSYLRALDFVGVVEAVAEVRKECEDGDRRREERWKGMSREKALRMMKEAEEREKRRQKRGGEGVVEIGDSTEDEESDDEDFGGSGDEDRGDEIGDEDEEMTEILVLDNFTSMAGGLFGETERDSAHNLLSTFNQTLHNLTKTHDLLTILLNSTTPLTSSNSKSNSHQHQQNNAYKPPNPTPNRSIFKSTAATLRPAFEKTFSQFPDLHLFLSRLPKTRRDAEVLYGSDDFYDTNEEGRGGGVGGYGRLGKGEVVEYCHVVEVLRDNFVEGGVGEGEGVRDGVRSGGRGRGRRGGREQRWAPFGVAVDGVGIEDVFGGGGERKGL